MLSDAVEYPTAGDDWVRTTVLGGALYLVALVVQFVGLGLTATGILAVIGIPLLVLSLVAFLPLWGYSVRVSRSVLAGSDVPPEFGGPGGLFREGAAVLVVSLVYGVPGLVVGVLALVGVGVGAVLPDEVGGLVVAVVLVVAGLVGAAYALVYAYVLPAALVAYAGTGEFGAAWDVGTLRDVVSDRDYAVAWVVAAVVWTVGQSVANGLAVVLVGFAVLFYAQVVCTYLLASGVADATDGALAPTATAGPDVDEGTTGGTGDVPPPPSSSPSPDDEGRADENGRGCDDDEDGATSPGDQDGEAAAAADDGATPTEDGEGDVPAGASGEATTAGEEDAPDADRPAAGDRRAEEGSGAALEDVTGVGPAKAEALREAGFGSVADLRAAGREELTAVGGIGPALADRIKDDVGDA